MQRLFLTAAAATQPLSALAHPGHDHSHWSSAGIHGFLVFSVLAVAAVTAVLLVRRRRAAQPLRGRSGD